MGRYGAELIGTDALSEVPEDLAKELDKDYMAPTVGSYKKNGKYYGVPMEYNLEYGGMIVNKSSFMKRASLIRQPGKNSVTCPRAFP